MLIVQSVQAVYQVNVKAVNLPSTLTMEVVILAADQRLNVTIVEVLCMSQNVCLIITKLMHRPVLQMFNSPLQI